MNIIAFYDAIYLTASFATAILLFINLKKKCKYTLSFFPIIGLCTVSILYATALFIEWEGISSSLEHYEDLVGALIPMFWIFLFYAIVQHQSNTDIRTSEERMQLAIKGTQAGLWDWSVQTGQLIISPRWAEIIGYTIEELQPISIETWINNAHPIDLEISNAKTAEHFANQTEYFESEVRMRHKNGNWIWVSTRGAVVERDANGAPIRMTGTQIDITEKKQNQIELEKHRQHLEILVQERTQELENVNEELKSINEDIFEKNEKINLQNSELQETLKYLRETQIQLLQAEKMASLGVLTAGVAHEINNPLNFIKGGYLGLVSYFNEPESIDPENISILLESINTGVERASAIVNGLNQFSRNKESYDEQCDIHLILENCLAMLQHDTKNRIEIRKQFNANPSVLTGNAGKLHQVFINILHNSIQSIAENGTITITTEILNNNLVVEVSDSGCGINPESMSRITDPFFTTKEPGDGTGLGLSITYSIIQTHNGKLEFESELNKGTKVKIVLPKSR